MNVLIVLYLLLIAPILLWERLRGKRHPGFKERIGLSLPKPTGPLIWIHAISVGEVKAASPLLKALKEKSPDAQFLITTTTATGQKEAKRSLKEANFIAYGPIDLSFVVKRWVKRLNPKQYILVESDFWPNLLRALKKNGTEISLVSGKISERSFNRFKLFSFFTKKLFSHFDHICVQNELYRSRFAVLVKDSKKIRVTGNLKFDLQAQPIQSHLKLPKQSITISCTHEPEEEWLLDALIKSDYFLILAPRHPERFKRVAELLEKKKIPFSTWKNREQIQKVLLVDVMGQLPACYAASQLTILGGSFVDHIGGHNVLEPLLYETPVFFGPHMFGQEEFKRLVLESGAGKEIKLKEIRQTVDAFFQHKEIEEEMKCAAKRVITSGRGTTQKTLIGLL